MPDSILESGAQDIKMYKQAVEDCRGTFISFVHVSSVDGLLHWEAEHFLKRMATCVASKWKKSYVATSEQGFRLPSSEQPAYAKGVPE